jgi:hypothetical protein
MKNVWMIPANGEKLYLELFVAVGVAGIAGIAIVVLLRR